MKLVRFLAELDWGNPRIVLSTICMILLVMFGGYFLTTGLIIALLMSISILWLVDKCPLFIKKLIKKHPLVSDLFFTSLAMGTFGGLFGNGLILAISGVFAGVILSWALSNIHIEEQVATA